MKLGVILYQEKNITREQLETALEYQKENPKARIGETLINLGFTDIKTIVGTLAKQQPTVFSFLLRFGEILLLEEIITHDQLQEALKYQQQHPKTKLGQAFINLGFATQETIFNVLQKMQENLNQAA